jgi:hypothetical protein
MAKNPDERYQTAEAMEAALVLWVAPNSVRRVHESNPPPHVALASTVADARNKRTRKTRAGKKRQTKPG